ncbi:MAG: hypothetical protein K0U24_05110 [Gammaproteobacteria bacterium]|nr:hypothetical protein [Gammaproteobacteria bacterium]MCH9716656.1 hypothetical protein [Gammaproteobacteria bacterium]MCH9763596.1 hypothetical protein [Gammaproteobacteria bacterium]
MPYSDNADEQLEAIRNRAKARPMDSPLREVKDNLVKDYREVMEMSDSSDEYKAEMTEGLTEVSEQINDLITKENYAKELAETANKIKKGPYLKDSLKAERHLDELHRDLDEAKEKLDKAQRLGDTEAVAQISAIISSLEEMQSETTENIKKLQSLNQQFETLTANIEQVGDAMEYASQSDTVKTIPGSNDQIRAQFENRLLSDKDQLNTLELKVNGLLSSVENAFKSIVSGIASIAESIDKSIA